VALAVSGAKTKRMPRSKRCGSPTTRPLSSMSRPSASGGSASASRQWAKSPAQTKPSSSAPSIISARRRHTVSAAPASPAAISQLGAGKAAHCCNDQTPSAKASARQGIRMSP